MSSSIVAFRSRRTLPVARAEHDFERRERRLITLTWFLLLFNTLTFYPGISFLHIPGAVGKGITQSPCPWRSSWRWP